MKGGRFVTKIIVIFIGLSFSFYFAAFAIYSLVSQGLAAGIGLIVGFILPAAGLATFHSFMLRALLKHRMAQKQKAHNKENINSSTPEVTSSIDKGMQKNTGDLEPTSKSDNSSHYSDNEDEQMPSPDGPSVQAIAPDTEEESVPKDE
ncbi:hypothetical protein ACA910_017304 [Epithemia clementina (nom. ined.)]